MTAWLWDNLPAIFAALFVAQVVWFVVSIVADRRREPQWPPREMRRDAKRGRR